MSDQPTPSAEQLAAELDEARRRIAALEAAGTGPSWLELGERLQDGFWLLDAEGVHLYVNPALCAMTGFAADELVGAGPPHPYWAADDLDAIREAFTKTLAGETATFALTFVRKSGERFPVLVTPTALRDNAGAVTSAFATVKDLSDLRRSEAALAESEELFRLTFDQAPFGAALVRPDFRFRRVNEAFCRMTGYTSEELLQLRFADITHPDDAAVDVPQIRRLTAGEIAEYAREKRYLRHDGRVAWGDVVVRPVRGPDGGVLAMLAMVNDITKRRRAEEQSAQLGAVVRAERDRLAALVASVPDEIWFSDASGTFTLANPAAVAEFGNGAAPGTDVRDLAGRLEVLRADGTPRPVEEAPPLRALAGETVRNLEEIVRTPGSGELRNRLVSSTPVRDPQGGIVGCVSVVRDITELRGAEAALRESEARYRSVVEASHEGIALQARDGTILAWNKAAQEVFGLTEGEIVGESAVAREWGTVHEDGTPWPASAHPSMRTLATGEPCENVIMGLRRGAEQRWLNVNTRPLWINGDDLPSAVVVSFADVTGQRLAVMALEAERARAQSYLDIADVMLVALDADGLVTLANRKTCEVLERDERDVVGRDWFDLAVPAQAREPLRELYRALVSGESEAYRNLENPILTAAGEERLIAWHNTLLHDGAGQITGLLRSGQDITEQRAAEQALCDSEERYRMLVRNAYDGVWVHEVSPDGPGKVIEVNDRVSEMLGYSRGELLAMHVSDVDTPEQRRRSPGIVAEIGRTGHAVFETEHVRKDGGHVPVEVSASLLELHGRAVVLSVVRDITERRAAQLALRESEERYRGVVERATDGIVITDHERLLFANAAFGHMSGYTMAELADKPFLDFVQPGDRTRVAERVRRRLAGGPEPTTYEIDLVGKDGHLFAVEVNVGTVSLGGETADLVIMRDISERRRALAALRELEAMRETAERVARVGSWKHDFATGLVSWSPETYKLYDVDEREFDGDFRTVLESRVHPDDRAAVADDIVRYEQGHRPAPLEYRVIHRDGSVRLLHAEGMLQTGAGGRPAAFIGFCQDVTEQRAAEQEIRRLNAELKERVISRTEQLDAATHELEALAYSMAHDVRAPLRTIDGFSAIVLEEEAGTLSAESTDNLQRVRAAAQTLARLMDDLSGLSAVSRHDLAREPLDVSAMAADVVEEARAAHGSRSVDVDIQPGLTAYADPHLVRLILWELLDNAWKFTTPRRHAHVQVGAVEGGEQPAFFVHDDGVGFDMAYATHLFGAFQRMHPPGDFAGDGIGLALVQRLVRRHGGRVWAESEVGEGATFFFTLPPGGQR